MGRKKLYTEKIIQLAKQMRDEGYTARSIVAILGFKSIYQVYLYTNKGAVQRAIKNREKYYKKNRAKILVQMKKYQQKRKLSTK